MQRDRHERDSGRHSVDERGRGQDHRHQGDENGRGDEGQKRHEGLCSPHARSNGSHREIDALADSFVRAKGMSDFAASRAATRWLIVTLAAGALLIAVVAAVLVYMGSFDVAADKRPPPPAFWLMD